MPEKIWLSSSIVIALLIIGFLAFFIAAKKYRTQKTNYKTLFIIGIIWLGAGIPLGISNKNWGFAVMGLLFAVVGLLNKKRWYNEPKWSELPPAQRKFKLTLLVILAILVLGGLAILLLANYKN
ncbi:MAG: hypothetical protein COU85_01255 [Candidatus Portnoybacteria bacterium CG10_big_fil_rev_8_21_14_0_10_44_7]|uniref:Uncharacterized protein n=1 Tax=Candidatus Portnoybacteria bacterium CG10_big_fil_rev_8_21_14_0_10_44_7 TaxID=1974816 RepID=A0A2M8KIY8_9BACT|nr:MAG: hypothetical protein COU85_01255 [Candidatus Portnoybacteria bacterium CG10_big_fil_rev_8_21_14_0_10_44_7]